MKYCLLLCSWLLVSLSLNAQNARTAVEAARFIKLGNTLRMVDRPQQAVNLLQRALPAVQQKDIAQEAIAYENLGYAYTDLENRREAVRCFQKATALYQKLGFTASEAAMRQLMTEAAGKDLYAGIDIGASGVKLAIFRTTYDNGFYAKDIRSKPLAPNVTLVSGTAQSFDAGRDVMKTYLDSIRHYNITPDRVYIAFSSGINESLGKTPEKKKKLYELLTGLVTTELPNGKGMPIDTTLTAAREAELFMVGTIPRKFWASTSCIDVGSGNTKGGYYDGSGQFRSISFSFGTKTLAAQIDNKRSLDISAYKEEALKAIRPLTDTTINLEFNTASPGLQQRKTVAFGGGIAWAMTAYLHPERAATTAVPLTQGDIDRFRQLALNDYQSLIHPDLSNLTDPVIRKKAEADLANAQNQFNEKQVIAGALLLDAIFRAYSNTSVPKRFVFIRDSDIGWVTGKFMEQLNQNYERAVAKGAQ
jgi:tetratricopeptide (TPR) repeat protein